ncbi:probable F420-dependent oxidoreductase, Rv3520c family [Streptomyces sp. DvalAA-14]|uniref:LLM class flavin-dependent oxidoreductase n=1 Tax=unclassified Streptomyces TaxID=2593676 RepID=UPI00081BB56F|nr:MULTISPECIES: LLM class flavin-dependent oxidoreductase [unclassified Streptomyces]MYS20710.1 LLM class flavin-dependent oxidoreductase [Streptomyces sp. SID4948]SCD75252.1 probable F420-dependent oxidoreductase, Rv3520c family [Streptomyces sp. DvalAA-14]
MKLGANLVYQGAGELARAADDLGYDVVLAPEGYRSDAASVLGLVAGVTKRVGLASGVMQIPARPPGLTALTAATLDALSGGRFRLGLGVSNPDVSDGWYGVRFDRPLARTREYVDIVRRALTGEPVEYRGEHFRLPASGPGGGAPLQVLTQPLRPRLPVYLAAVGPRNLRLAGEIADGWIGVFTAPDAVAAAVREIAAGRAAAGLDMTGFDVLPSLPTAVGDDVETAVDQLRAHYVYMLGIGDPEHNFYVAMARRMGFGAEIEVFLDRLAAGDRTGAGAGVPAEFVDRTALVGPVDRLAGRMKEYDAAGVTTLGIMVSAAATSLDGRLHILRVAAAALDRSGVGG